MRTMLRYLAVGSLLLLGTGACSDLEVVNLNDPDAGRSLSSAGDVESLISGSYNTWFNGVYNYSGPGMFLSNQAFQHTAPWANAGMEQYGRLPRMSIQNDVADNYYGNFTRVWTYSYRAIAALADGLRALEDPDIADELGAESVARAKAYGKFVQGLAHATVAVYYDRGFAVDETTDLTAEQEALDYTALFDVAMGYFDEAISLSSTSFDLEFGWLQANVSNQDLARLAHSLKARYMAALARTSAERDALNWNAIISEVNAGIQEDFIQNWDWDNGWYNEQLDYSTWPNWTQMGYWIWGMADQSGNYQAWLATDHDAKGATLPDGTQVLIVTPDTRFPQGTTVDEQRETTGEYFRIATASEAGDTWKRPDRGVWRWSWYKNSNMLVYGWDAVFDQPEIRMQEMNLLKAEGLFRTGDKAGAAAIINESRTAHGLSATDANGTNASCVPKLPNESCGDLWEMLKWEKRLETVHTGISGAGWWFDSRGWGDLWADTPVMWPVPCKELQVLQLLPCNTYGGPGGEFGAPGSSYGWTGPGEG